MASNDAIQCQLRRTTVCRPYSLSCIADTGHSVRLCQDERPLCRHEQAELQSSHVGWAYVIEVRAFVGSLRG
jgi:hypothetical protein